MFDRLLLAIDDSPASEVATAFATALAVRTSASVHVVHVNEYVVGGRGVTLHTTEDARTLVLNAVDELRDWGVRAGGSSVFATYRQVPQRIVEVADEREANAIVLGSNRYRRWGRLFSAHVRERTTRLTSLPILAAPAPLKVAAFGVDDVLRAQVEAEISVFLP